MNERTSRLGQTYLAEDRHELEPHSPATSHSSWNAEGAETPSGILKGPRRKGSQCRLRAWIAIDRHSLQFISDEQRCTCPMVGCERLFPSPESMHLHLKTCVCISRGLYRCIETGTQVKVGTCDSDGCHELKDRFVRAVSSSFESVRRVGRHLSGRHSKPKQASQLCFKKELVLEERHSLEAILDSNTSYIELAGSDHMYPAEMGPAFDGAAPAEHELDARVIPSELYSTPNSYHASTNLHEEHSTSTYFLDNDLAACCEQEGPRDTAPPQAMTTIDCTHPVFQNSANTPSHLAVQSSHKDMSAPSFPGTMCNHTGPVELCAKETPWSYHRPYPSDSAWELSSPAWTIDSGGNHTNDSATTFTEVTTPAWQDHNAHRLCQSTAPTLNVYDNSEKIVVDNFGFPDVNVLPRPAFNNPQGASRTDSSSSSDPSIHLSMFSSFSSISTGQSSLASCKPAPTNFDSASFLGEDSMMFDEPETMEPSPMCKLQEEEYHGHAKSSMRRCDTAGVSFDNYVKPGCYLSRSTLDGCQVPQKLHITKKQDTPSPRFAPQSSTSLPNVTTAKLPSKASVSTSAATPLSSFLAKPSSSQPVSPGKANCRHCGLTCDMSNRSRHEKNCKQNPDSSSVPRIPCHYPGCTSTFNRKDNLTQHQRSQNHFTVGNVELKISLSPSPGSPAWDWAMQALGQQQGSGELHAQGDEFWMDFDDGK
ncbi:hypothetical protein DL95DRAFT_460955 [Leptodontidium sp. 2 PMI_412]|nr:hypothetical protein DL95DRAFT_460955 [Leptodontidium sp. 2 PMI_412]